MLFRSHIFDFEFGDCQFTVELDNDKLRVLDRVSFGLTNEPQEGEDQYATVHREVHNCIKDLFGEEAVEKIFGDRPESVFDDLDVFAALNNRVANFMAARLNAAYGPASVIKPQ